MSTKANHFCGHTEPKSMDDKRGISASSNAEGAMLSVASAAVPYRLILLLNDGYSYVFANDMEDPVEL
jgi:hypothetical protein